VQGSNLNPLESLTPPLTKRLGFAEQKDPEQVRREAQHQAEFAAEMTPSRQLHEEGHLAKDAVEAAGLIKQLGKPAAKKAPTGTCEHGRRKHRCKDCGTGYCKHGRQKGQCKDCGTGHCQHGRQKNACKDCGTDYWATGQLGNCVEHIASEVRPVRIGLSRHYSSSAHALAPRI
jgi:hypothetical protein